MMDFRKLKTFQAVADCLNLTKAADQLGYTQPTITVQLQSLESELGVTLFNRIGNKNFLTPSGKVVKQYIDQAFDVLDQMERELRKMENPHGLLTIAAPEFYCTHYLSMIIHSYISQNPQVKLQLFSCDSNEAMKKVASSEADLAIIAGPCHSPTMESLLLGKEDLILVTTKEMYEAHKTRDLLEKHPFITYKSGSNLQKLVNECLDEYGISPTNYIECVSDETIKRTVLYHTGTALLGSALIENDLKKGVLVELHRFPGKIETSMVVLKQRMDEKNIKSFADNVKGIWKTCI
ncbi:DNA-binding transcriptional regulator, LysR family [Paenibacillus sp. yr247]|uniref:LysR family transcriptional regulator n=1 Tax=Paenibacillus sp. yr247 TaxID=1761880 RepID=UPI000882315B|nr:LysR family transcriptional regulator [Paenibacillus sp. yr247]SDN24001.1 DNA-binding transcriptional regulator, LysR family [Paenibacillus sp. yr247]